MAINYNEIQQKIDNVLYNSDEFVRRWVDFLTAPSGTVTVEYYDQNGNLQTASFDNRSKVVQDFIANVNSAMQKTFYVDAVNGNDANDGSQNAPFKTLAKAIYSVPPGGHVWIRLLSDIVVSDSGKINMGDSNRVVIIDGYNGETPDNRRTVQFKFGLRSLSVGTYNTVYGFTNLGGCVFGLSYVNIEFIGSPDSNYPFDSYAQAFDYSSHASNGFGFYFSNSKVTIPNILGVGLAKAGGAGIGTVMFNCYDSEINTAGSDSYAFYMQSSTFIYNVNQITLSGAKTNHADIIYGIVRDANGVPRNVISNIVL